MVVGGGGGGEGGGEVVCGGELVGGERWRVGRRGEEWDDGGSRGQLLVVGRGEEGSGGEGSGGRGSGSEGRGSYREGRRGEDGKDVKHGGGCRPCFTP